MREFYEQSFVKLTAPSPSQLKYSFIQRNIDMSCYHIIIKLFNYYMINVSALEFMQQSKC